MKSPINARQARFCELVAAGESQTDAWLKAGYKASKQAAAVNASKCLRNAKIVQYIADLRSKQTEEALLSRDAKRRLLAAIALDPSQKALARIRAIEADSRIAGHFEPEHHVVDTGPNTLASIKERAAKMISTLSIAHTVAKK